MEWYADEVRSLEQMRKQEAPGRIMFYGSSSFRLWETLTEDLSPWPVVNHAFGGSTLAACVHFFERLVKPYAPRSLICYAGDNDLGDGQAPASVIASFRTLLGKVDQHLGPIPFAFVSIKASPARWYLREQICTVNEAIREELRARTLGYYIDVYHPMLNRDGTPRQTLFADDGLHLSPEGYQLWTEILAAYRYPLLEP